MFGSHYTVRSSPSSLTQNRKRNTTILNFSVTFWKIEIFSLRQQKSKRYPQRQIDMLFEHKGCSRRSSLPSGSSGLHIRARATARVVWVG